MLLVPCGSCRRHVVERELACPFCGAPRRAERSVVRVFIGRTSRAAVFSSLAACWSSSSPAQQKTTTPPPPPQEQVQTARDVSPPSQGLYGVLTDDKSGAPLAGVVITAYAMRTVVEATTNERGEFSLELAKGDHQLAFTGADGTRYAAGRIVTIEEGQAQRLDIPLDRTPMAMPKPYGAPPARRRTV